MNAKESQTILVTGGAGYIGSHTVHALIQDGYTPIVLDSLENGRSNALPPEVPFYEGSVRNEELIRRIHAEHPFERVVHFAAYIEAGESMKDPLKFFSNNTAASIEFINTLENIGVRDIVFSSTAAVYGIPEIVPIPENHSKKPVNYYGLSKLMVEQVLESCVRTYNWNVVILRYFNAAGAGFGIGEQHNPETHLIPIVLEVASGKRDYISIYGVDYNTDDGTCVRDYIHVLDLAQAHIRALESLSSSTFDTFNVGSGNGFSVRELINTCKKVSGVDFKVREAERREGDPDTLVADTTHISERLNWSPRYSLQDIVESAWAWEQTKGV